MSKFKNGDLLLKDNQRVYFGDSKDKEIYFNGTNFIISDAIIGSTDLTSTSSTFTSAGSATFNGPTIFNNTIIIERETVLPGWTPDDEGRIIYNTTNQTIYYGTNTGWEIVGSGAGGGALTTVIATTSINASANWRVEVDTDTSALTITLPPSAGLSLGDIVEVEDYTSNAETNNVSIVRNGSPIGGIEEDALIDIDGAKFTFLWVGGDEGWKWIIDSQGSGLPNKVVHRKYHNETATQNQTDFNIPWTIDTNQIDIVVYLDGIKQKYSSAFTLPNNTTVRFTEALAGGEIAEFATIDVTALADIGNLYSVTGDTKVAATSGGAIVYGSLSVSGDILTNTDLNVNSIAVTGNGTFGNITATGTLTVSGGIRSINENTNNTGVLNVYQSDSNKMFTNTGASGPVTFNLNPNIEIGTEFIFVKTTDREMNIVAPSADGQIIMDNYTITNSTSGELGANLSLIKATSTLYVFKSGYGTWSTS